MKTIRIQNIMPKTVQKQTGVDKLSRGQLASLNAWLNLKKTKVKLGPGPINEGVKGGGGGG